MDDRKDTRVGGARGASHSGGGQVPVVAVSSKAKPPGAALSVAKAQCEGLTSQTLRLDSCESFFVRGSVHAQYAI